MHRIAKENRKNEFVRIYDPVLTELKKLAKKDQRTFANYINHTLKQHVEEKQNGIHHD